MSTTQNTSGSGKFSVRNSVFIWVAGAIFGWVLMVVSVYNVLRNSDDHIVTPQSEIEAPGILADQAPKTLNEIAPASGGGTPKDEPEDPIDEKPDGSL